ncbi:YciI family protein [Nocardia tengchongensis]|uniref:YciI family protein n=1 Tax=Nocardia tengchongensis TaxID=2055889 RepID=UPI003610CBFC
MAEWIFFMHPPRDNFIATMTADERSAFAAHRDWLARLDTAGVLLVAGPTLGTVNTGVGIFTADDEASARRIIADEPVTSGGFMRGDLRPIQLGYLNPRTESEPVT